MFRKRIQDAYDSLSPRFKRIALFILENTLDVGFLTATQLANRVSVDPATVVRFAQELGYTGYRQLSKEIKTQVSEQLALRNRKGIFQNSGIEVQIAQIIDDISERLLDMKADIGATVETAKNIVNAEKIYVTGTSDVYGLALTWSTYLALVGLPVYSFELNILQPAMLLKNAGEQDIIIAISMGLDPGVQLSQLLEMASRKGIKTIAVTTNPSLLPARYAQTNLTTNAKTPFDYPSFDTLAAQLSVLWQAIMLIKNETVVEDVNLTVHNINALLEETDRKSPYDPAILKHQWEK